MNEIFDFQSCHYSLIFSSSPETLPSRDKFFEICAPELTQEERIENLKKATTMMRSIYERLMKMFVEYNILKWLNKN